MADSRLKDLAATILNYLVDALTTQGIAVPEHRYTHAGEIAQDLVGPDCAEALILSWVGTFQGHLVRPGGIQGVTFGPNNAMHCAVPLVAQFAIVLLRCVPTLSDGGKPPSLARLQASADQIQLDAMTLPVVVIDGQLAGTLTNMRCTLAGIGSVTPIGPQGGVGGTQLTLSVGLV